MTAAITDPMRALIRDREDLAGVLRFGVFFGGGWFGGLWRYLAEASHWRSAPTFLGVHGAIRWFLHLQGHPLDAVTLDCAHYVLGRVDSGEGGAGGNWDRVPHRYGIVRHDAQVVDGREKNADAPLKQVAYQHAAERALNAVALITGDGDLLPLVHRLTRHGITVVVPSLPEIRYNGHTGRRWIRSSPKLAAAATHVPRLGRPALDRDPAGLPAGLAVHRSGPGRDCQARRRRLPVRNREPLGPRRGLRLRHRPGRRAVARQPQPPARQDAPRPGATGPVHQKPAPRRK